MSVIQQYFPAANATALTLAFGSLASDAANMLAGRASTAVDNNSNLDLDHLLQGAVVAGTSAPTAGGIIEGWIYAPIAVAAGPAYTYPDSITGTDAAKTMTSRNVLLSGLRRAFSITVDGSAASRVYPVAPVSIASLFGGSLPRRWGLLLINGTSTQLNATQTIGFSYERIQSQVN